MLSSIIVRCPGCAARIKAPIQLLGQQRNCPGCQRRFVIRPQVPPDLGSLLVRDEPEPIGQWLPPARSVLA
jgi:hypothetical protein